MHFFGGRGISVLRASDMENIWDSENEMEFFHVLLYEDVFNANLDIQNPVKDKPSSFVDQQSDNKVNATTAINMGTTNMGSLLRVEHKGHYSEGSLLLRVITPKGHYY